MFTQVPSPSQGLAQLGVYVCSAGVLPHHAHPVGALCHSILCFLGPQADSTQRTGGFCWEREVGCTRPTRDTRTSAVPGRQEADLCQWLRSLLC